MTNGNAQIEFLERLYGQEVKTMDQDLGLNRLIERALSDSITALSRAGKDGAWCFGCGVSGVSLDRCACNFGESFGCTRRLFCGDCRAARRAVAGHIEKVFAAKVVNRVSSIRLRLLRELRGAARAIEGEDSDAGDERLLSFWLSNADEFSSDGDGFRAGVLRAFRKTHFLDFAGLAKALRQQQDESLIRAVIRSGLYR